MLRLDNKQPSLWESVLPPELFEMSEELAKIDGILDDERFFAPFMEKFYNRVGRPTIPVATYLRMMYLKRRYKLGYETLVKEVNDSFTWRLFCHIPLNHRAPDESTLTGLLADGIGAITRTVVKLKKVGAEIGSGFVSHTGKVRKTCLGISKLLKERISKNDAGLIKAKRQLVEIAKRVIASGREVKAQIEGLEEKQ